MMEKVLVEEMTEAELSEAARESLAWYELNAELSSAIAGDNWEHEGRNALEHVLRMVARP